MGEAAKTNEYSEVLAPAVVAGSERLTALGVNPDACFMDKAEALLTQTLRQLDTVDWANSDLPPGQSLMDGEMVTLEPRAFAQDLTIHAFEDSIVLMEMAIKSTRPKTSPVSWIVSRLTGRQPKDDIDSQNLRDMLLESKQTLLNKVLGLSGGDKFALFATLQRPSESRIRLGFRFGELSPPIQQSEVSGKTKFVWNDQVEHWAKEHYQPGRGCPARNFLIDTPNGKQPIPHYLWDQLVLLRLPEQTLEQDAAILGSIATQVAAA